MTTPRSLTDASIVRQLRRLSDGGGDYWTFRHRAARPQTQGLTQYPAMMVPAMQAELIRVVARADGNVSKVFDPFAGSGTTQVECMRLGLNYVGQDVNPLAVLLCRTKAGPFQTSKLQRVVKEVVQEATADSGIQVESDFPGLRKWFSPVAIANLSSIRRAIRTVDNVWCRRVLWTCLAETVRLTSNSRTSTFKLHIRTRDDLETRRVSPLRTFATIADDFTHRLQEEATSLRRDGHLSNNGWYRGDVSIRLADSRKSPDGERYCHDLLVTSPPYGDNRTTVPYGQYSYLPLQWIDLHDIHEAADVACLRTTCEIDNRSLGGSTRNAVQEVRDLLDVSPSLAQTLRRLKELPSDRAQRVAAYCRDLRASIKTALDAVRSHAYMIWTVGNRCVGGHPVPTDAILTEMLTGAGAIPVERVDRRIPTKRMAVRNSTTTTMREEAILIFRTRKKPQ